MGRWVTLQDDQKVFISAGGKVLASRSAISKAGGAKERGKSLAARSKTAITRNAFSAVRARSFFKSGEEKARLKSEISQHLAKREHHEAAVKSKQLTELEKQSPATARAIEHAKEMAGIRKGATDAQITTAGREGKIGPPSSRTAHSGTTASSIRARDITAKADKMAAGAAKTPGVNMEARTKAAERYASESTKDRTARLAANRTTRAIEHAKAASTKPIGMTYHDVHPAKAIQAGVPDAVRSVNFHDPSGRTYINVHTNDSFRGDRSLKLFVDIKGTLVHEYGRGTVSPPAKADRDAILAHAKKIGVRVEDRPTHR